MSVNEIFKEAAEYLEENDWIQGSYVTMAGPRCAMGAILRAAGGDILLIKAARSYLNIYLSEHYGYYGQVEAWNDEDERTKEDVILAFKELAYDN